MTNACTMKQSTSTSLIFLLLLFLFSGCSTAQKLQTNAPFNHDEVYCQKWIAGIKEGGSGINLFIPVSSELSKNVHLDSVYFRGKAALLEKIEGEKLLFVGRFKTDYNEKQDAFIINLSNEKNVKQTTILDEKFPFKLKDSECVLSYKEGKETKYFKIENIVEKRSQNYPSTPIRHE